MSALTTAFIICAVLCFAAAICCALRGEKNVHREATVAAKPEGTTMKQAYSLITQDIRES